MMYRLLPTVLLTVFIPATALHGEDAAKDLDKLQGTWTVTAMENNGEAISKEITDMITVTFKKDKMVMDGALSAAKGEEPTKPEFTVKLDPSKKPKALDTTALNGTFKGKTQPGIYQI